MVSQGPLVVVLRDEKDVKGVEGLQRYRGVEAWKEWTQAHHPFGQEAVEECALREENFKSTRCWCSVLHTYTLCTVKSSQYKACYVVSFPVCHGLRIGPNTYLSWC